MYAVRTVIKIYKGSQIYYKKNILNVFSYYKLAGTIATLPLEYINT